MARYSDRLADLYQHRAELEAARGEAFDRRDFEESGAILTLMDRLDEEIEAAREAYYSELDAEDYEDDVNYDVEDRNFYLDEEIPF